MILSTQVVIYIYINVYSTIAPRTMRSRVVGFSHNAVGGAGMMEETFHELWNADDLYGVGGVTSMVVWFSYLLS